MPEDQAIRVEIDTSVERIRAAKDAIANDPAAASEARERPLEFFKRFGVNISQETLNALQAQSAAKKAALGNAQAGFVHIDL